MVANKQPAKGQADEPKGPVSRNGRPRRRRLIAVLSALGTLVVLPLVVWAIESYGPTAVSSLRGGGPPVTVVVQGYDTGDGAAFAFPRGRSLSPGPGAGCTNFIRWGHDHGGFLQSGSENLLIIVQGTSSQQAIIESLRPRILSRQPSPNGVQVAGCFRPGVKGSVPTYDLNFDLDRLTPAYYAPTPDSSSVEKTLQAYSASSTDSDVFNLVASSEHYTYKWVVEMRVVQNGHVYTIDVRAPDGQPFATTPQTYPPIYYEVDETDGTWWRYTPTTETVMPGPPPNK